VGHTTSACLHVPAVCHVLDTFCFSPFCCPFCRCISPALPSAACCHRWHTCHTVRVLLPAFCVHILRVHVLYRFTIPGLPVFCNHLPAHRFALHHRLIRCSLRYLVTFLPPFLPACTTCHQFPARVPATVSLHRFHRHCLPLDSCRIFVLPHHLHPAWVPVAFLPPASARLPPRSTADYRSGFCRSRSACRVPPFRLRFVRFLLFYAVLPFCLLPLRYCCVTANIPYRSYPLRITCRLLPRSADAVPLPPCRVLPAAPPLPACVYHRHLPRSASLQHTILRFSVSRGSPVRSTFRSFRTIPHYLTVLHRLRMPACVLPPLLLCRLRSAVLDYVTVGSAADFAAPPAALPLPDFLRSVSAVSTWISCRYRSVLPATVRFLDLLDAAGFCRLLPASAACLTVPLDFRSAVSWVIFVSTCRSSLPACLPAFVPADSSTAVLVLGPAFSPSTTTTVLSPPAGALDFWVPPAVSLPAGFLHATAVLPFPAWIFYLDTSSALPACCVSGHRYEQAGLWCRSAAVSCHLPLGLVRVVTCVTAACRSPYHRFVRSLPAIGAGTACACLGTAPPPGFYRLPLNACHLPFLVDFYLHRFWLPFTCLPFTAACRDFVLPPFCHVSAAMDYRRLPLPHCLLPARIRSYRFRLRICRSTVSLRFLWNSRRVWFCRHAVSACASA